MGRGGIADIVNGLRYGRPGFRIRVWGGGGGGGIGFSNLPNTKDKALCISWIWGWFIFLL